MSRVSYSIIQVGYITNYWNIVRWFVEGLYGENNNMNDRRYFDTETEAREYFNKLKKSKKDIAIKSNNFLNKYVQDKMDRNVYGSTGW